MNRNRSSSAQLRDEAMLAIIQPIKAEHPAWGYRRIWAYLKYREQIPVSKRRIYRILKEHNLLAINTRRLRAIRTERAKSKCSEPNRLWGIDMTKIRVKSSGWCYFEAVKDWAGKKIVGCSLSLTSKTRDWLNALEMGINRQFPLGIMGYEPLMLVSDNGCQPTSTAFMAACSVLGVKQIFTSFCNPKGNADTERFFRTLKEDLVWPREFETYAKLDEALTNWIKSYNEDFPHSAIGYQTPEQYEKNHTFNHQLNYKNILQVFA